MLMQTNRASAQRCLNGWRLRFSVLLLAALMLVTGLFGVRGAHAQATPQEEAAQRQAEIDQLRAQQEQIKAQLDLLQLEKQKLSRELEQRKAEGAERAQDAAAVYKRIVAQREQAIAQVKDAEAAEREQAAKDQQNQAWNKWNEDRVARGRAEQNEFAGRAQLDLVSLANNYVDAVGSVSLAEVRIQAMEQKQDQVGMRIEKVNMDTAKRKVAIFRGIAEAAREAAKADFDMASQQVQNGLAPKTSLNEAKSRLKILEVILAQ